jgi:tetratricopeptide (TPR) repeat protein
MTAPAAAAATAAAAPAVPAAAAGAASLAAPKADPRQRTMSMAQRMSKQTLADGFDLWDRGYVLGAMRLFTFKAENAPPFQVGQILDAMGHLLLSLEEFEDARENFTFAVEKYELIQQPILAKVMAAKAVEAIKGPEAAFELMAEAVKQFDGEKQSADATLKDKAKAPFGRMYQYRGQLLLALGKTDEALADTKRAVELGFERVHIALVQLGQAEEDKGNAAGAIAAYKAALAKNANVISAYLPLALLLEKDDKKAEALEVLSRAIELHPRAIFIRQKSYLLSELSAGKEADALAFLDGFIKNPPHEEAESVFSAGGSSVGEMYKAKAAILADAGKLPEAKAAAQEALKLNKNDEEAVGLLAAIESAIATPASPEKSA